MKPVTKSAFLAGALILTVLAGCDNVSWGGADVTVVPPPPRVSGGPLPTALEPGAERLPSGPILYRVTVDDGAGRLHPVGEIAGDSLRVIEPGRNAHGFADAFIAEHLRQGSEFVLFRGGARAGTLVVQSAAAGGGSRCRPLPEARGALELGAGATDLTEFLALARLQAPQVPRRIGEREQPTRTMQVLGPILAERLLRARRAPLPSNWQRAMAQLRPIPVAGAQAPGFTATFLIADTLGPGLTNEGHSLFFVAAPTQFGYDTVFVRYQNYAEGGKQAPRLVDALDWDRSGEVNLLLQVYSVDEAWFEAVGRSAGGVWRRTFSDRCPPALPADDAGGEPAASGTG
jgi:hypothetical protein